MKELGENAADFDRLHDSLRKAFAPCDGFEQIWVEDMAELRWRRLRFLRAEAGVLAAKKRKFTSGKSPAGEKEPRHRRKGCCSVSLAFRGYLMARANTRKSWTC
jgi:hypothetical protein